MAAKLEIGALLHYNRVPAGAVSTATVALLIGRSAER